MEVGSFCEAKNKALKLKNGLCSGFELHDAEYDFGDHKLVAKLRSTGGLRMQFGLVPSRLTIRRHPSAPAPRRIAPPPASRT